MGSRFLWHLSFGEAKESTLARPGRNTAFENPARNTHAYWFYTKHPLKTPVLIGSQPINY
jgi:hypothetical protein